MDQKNFDECNTERGLDLETRLVAYDAAPGDAAHPTSTPIYQTATFAQESATEFGRFDYSRSGNPTRAVLEAQLARLEGGTRAFAFASGMAALVALVRTLSVGDEIVAANDLYGGTYRLLHKVLPRAGITARHVDSTDLESVERAMNSRVKLLFVETPSNPLLLSCDIAALAAIAHRHGALLAVDSSMMSPYLQRPLELGADVVLHSATKLLSGHADLTAGVLVTRESALGNEIAFLQNAEGAALSPFESWLLLRGLKTLAIRVDRQQQNAVAVAHALAALPAVSAVYYPGLAEHPGRDLHAQQAAGPGVVLSFATGDADFSKRIVESLKLFTIAVSFGSINSTVSLPAAMSHASIPDALKSACAFGSDLIRISVGIESADDLIADLQLGIDLARSSSSTRVDTCIPC